MPVIKVIVFKSFSVDKSLCAIGPREPELFHCITWKPFSRNCVISCTSSKRCGTKTEKSVQEKGVEA